MQNIMKQIYNWKYVSKANYLGTGYCKTMIGTPWIKETECTKSRSLKSFRKIIFDLTLHLRNFNFYLLSNKSMQHLIIKLMLKYDDLIIKKV